MDKISNKFQIPNSNQNKNCFVVDDIFSLQWLIAGMSSSLVIGGGYSFVSNIVVFS
jgi:hypothetical protein